MKNFGLAIILILLSSLSGCLNSDLPDTSAKLAAEIRQIETYLDNNNITNFVKDPSGVFYTIEVAGNGELPTLSDYVNLTYVCKLFSGVTAFQQTSVPEILNVGLIGLTGLRIALPKFPVGTTATVYIPSVLAYGTGTGPNVPADTNIIIELSVLDVMSTEDEIFEVQKTTIDNYVLENEIQGVQVDVSGIRYIMIEEGAGAKPTLSNSVNVKYKGALLLNDEVFDEKTTPVTFDLGGNFIDGWKIALQLMPEGSKAKFFIPSELAYKTQGFYNPSNPAKSIPANAILVFDIELVEIL